MKTSISPQSIWRTFHHSLALAAFIGGVFSAIGDPLQPTSVVGVPSSPPAGGSSDSLAPIISSDGRYVVFASFANNLALLNTPNPAPPQIPAVLNVFRRDRLTQTIRLVSVSLDGAGGGNGQSMPCAVSTNGQFVLFESAATNLVASDNNNSNDIFLRDVVNNTTTLVSISTNGAAANGASRSAVMTPDGRSVAFVSVANNLTPDDTNTIADVFVRDLQTSSTVIASANAAFTSGQAFGGASDLPRVNAGGRYVAFYSTATNLVSGVTNSGEIYLRDLLLGTTTWASTNAKAIMTTVMNNPNVRSFSPEISDDGLFVAYEACPVSSSATRATTNGVMLRYRVADVATDLVDTNALGIDSGSELVKRNLTMTPNGRFIAYVANVFGVNGTQTGIKVWDGVSNTTVIASLNLSLASPANVICDFPAINPSGRYVAFLSYSNLVNNPVVAGMHLYRRDLQTSTTVLIDTDLNGSGSLSNLMTLPQLSDDGNLIAFEAMDGNFVPGDNNRAYDVFVRNVAGSSTELISAGLPGLPSLAANGSCVIARSCISTNGRYVAFVSESDNLTAGDTNGFRDAYVHDLLTGSNYLASATPFGTSGNGITTEAALSGNGRYAAFTSTSTNLVSGVTTQAVFLRDLQSATTALVSLNTNGTGSGNGLSYSPTVNDDGRFVLFQSRAFNIVPGGVGNNGGNLFWRDMQAGTNRALTVFSSGATVNSIQAAMSANGRRVAFGVTTNNAVSTLLRVWDAQLGQYVYTNVVPAVVSAVGISPDGNRLIYYRPTEVNLVDLTSLTQLTFSNYNSRAAFQYSPDSQFLAYVASSNIVFLYDFAAAMNRVVSAVTNVASDFPALSIDGRYVAYRSLADLPALGDTNGLPDIFLYDRQFGQTTLVTASPYGNWPANGRSFNPIFSGDGQTLIWQSWANNLAPQTFNQWYNIFAMSSFTSVSNASPSSFAISQFGYSSLNGFGAAPQEVPTLTWPLLGGSNYLVQFRTNLNDAPWQPLFAPVKVIGNQGIVLDADPQGDQKFYRVLAY